MPKISLHVACKYRNETLDCLRTWNHKRETEIDFFNDRFRVCTRYKNVVHESIHAARFAAQIGYEIWRDKKCEKQWFKYF